MRIAALVADRIIEWWRLRTPSFVEARRLLSSSPLFDRAFYLARNPDVDAAGLDPVEHYLLHGAAEGRDPHPLFSTRYYLSRNPDVARSRMDPFVHFLVAGMREGRDPHPLFATDHYLRSTPDADRPGGAAFEHFLGPEGAARGGAPHPLFDVANYLERYPEAAAGSAHPLLHFLQESARRRFDPHPLFDTAYYLDHNPDVRASGANALAHFVEFGDAEERDPHPLFSTAFYRAHNPDVAGMNALVHFVRYGGREGRDPHPLFDTSWYSIRNPVVAERGINPLAHFVLEGARQGRDPRPVFDCAFYSRRYQTGGVNPLEDFLRTGAGEGRIPNPRFRLWTEGRRNRRNLLALYAALARQTMPSADCAIGADEYRDWVARHESAGGDEVPSSGAADRPPSAGGNGLLISIVRAANGAERLAAMRAAEGEWVAAIGPLDVPAADALSALAAHVRSDPDAAVVYGDDDVIDATGERLRPHFKPDWNRDLFYSTHYTDGLVFVRRDVLDRIEGAGLDAAESSGAGVQMFAEMLRLLEAGARISHLPGVRLHRYRRAGGRVRVASDIGQKRQNDARARLLAAHFQRLGIAAEVRGEGGRYRRVVWPLPGPAPVVSVMVPTRDRLDLLRRCLEGVMNGTTYPHVDLVVVDNGSTDPATLAYLEELRGRRGVAVLEYPHAFNYSAINNLAARHARGSLLCLLNNDVEVVHADWLERMVRYFSRPEVGVVGAKLYYPGDRVQHAGIVIGLGGVAGSAFRLLEPSDPGYFGRAIVTQELSAVTAAAMVVRRSAFEEVGGLDERRFKVAFNDIDLCLRMRGRGHRILYAADVALRHQESASLGPPLAPRRSEQFRRERLAFQERWPDFIDDDPHYNPNLSLESDYRLAEPPRLRRPRTDRPIDGRSTAS